MTVQLLLFFPSRQDLHIQEGPPPSALVLEKKRKCPARTWQPNPSTQATGVLIISEQRSGFSQRECSYAVRSEQPTFQNRITNIPEMPSCVLPVTTSPQRETLF